MRLFRKRPALQEAQNENEDGDSDMVCLRGLLRLSKFEIFDENGMRR